MKYRITVPDIIFIETENLLMLSQQLTIVVLVFSRDFQFTNLSKLFGDSFSSMFAAPLTPLMLRNVVDDIRLKMSHLLAIGIVSITNSLPPVLKISTRVQPC